MLFEVACQVATLQIIFIVCATPRQRNDVVNAQTKRVGISQIKVDRIAANTAICLTNLLNLPAVRLMVPIADKSAIVTQHSICSLLPITVRTFNKLAALRTLIIKYGKATIPRHREAVPVAVTVVIGDIPTLRRFALWLTLVSAVANSPVPLNWQVHSAPRTLPQRVPGASCAPVVTLTVSMRQDCPVAVVNCTRTIPAKLTAIPLTQPRLKGDLLSAAPAAAFNGSVASDPQ